jgi:hypothetical protein
MLATITAQPSAPTPTFTPRPTQRQRRVQQPHLIKPVPAPPDFERRFSWDEE